MTTSLGGDSDSNETFQPTLQQIEQIEEIGGIFDRLAPLNQALSISNPSTWINIDGNIWTLGERTILKDPIGEELSAGPGNPMPRTETFYKTDLPGFVPNVSTTLEYLFRPDGSRVIRVGQQQGRGKIQFMELMLGPDAESQNGLRNHGYRRYFYDPRKQSIISNNYTVIAFDSSNGSYTGQSRSPYDTYPIVLKNATIASLLREYTDHINFGLGLMNRYPLPSGASDKALAMLMNLSPSEAEAIHTIQGLSGWEIATRYHTNRRGRVDMLGYSRAIPMYLLGRGSKLGVDINSQDYRLGIFAVPEAHDNTVEIVLSFGSHTYTVTFNRFASAYTYKETKMNRGPHGIQIKETSLLVNEHGYIIGPRDQESTPTLKTLENLKACRSIIETILDLQDETTYRTPSHGRRNSRR